MISYVIVSYSYSFILYDTCIYFFKGIVIYTLYIYMLYLYYIYILHLTLYINITTHYYYIPKLTIHDVHLCNIDY